MQKMWEFFEALDEMVYASDLETHELLYMNRHLRTALGYDKPEEYVGKKCYEVLQGGNAPCSFCNNMHLEAGEFVSWIHKESRAREAVSGKGQRGVGQWAAVPD